MAELRKRGFRIAVDDLGAGYAGLTSFVTLEPEFVKLDMSLIRDIDQHATKRKLVGFATQHERETQDLIACKPHRSQRRSSSRSRKRRTPH